MAKTTPNHTQTVSGWAAHDSSGKITPYTFKRRENGGTDVTIKILYCGICHTDVHHAKDDWGITMYPVVPGHEITGVITKVGSDVEGFKDGDKVGVGCLAASCLDCEYFEKFMFLEIADFERMTFKQNSLTFRKFLVLGNC